MPVQPGQPGSAGPQGPVPPPGQESAAFVPPGPGGPAAGVDGVEREKVSVSDSGDEGAASLAAGAGPASGDAVLRAFQASGAQGPAQAQAAAPSSSAAAVQEVAREVAERILVSEAAPGGRQEVRIFIKESVLPGTEVRLTRHEGTLTVELLTTAPESGRVLTEHRDSLVNQLRERLGQDVQVEVRSRETGRESGQGRSRGQRDQGEEMREDED